VEEHKKLTTTQVEEVLRRAVELDSRHRELQDSTFTEEDVERLGSEIGVSQGSVRDALVQVQAETLARPSQRLDTFDRWFGPRWFVATRTVPGPPRDVLAFIGSAFQQQLFRVQRNFGETVVWVGGHGLVNGLRQTFDFSGNYYLHPAEVIVSTIMETPGRKGQVDVRLEVGMPSRRRDKIYASLTSLTALGGTSALMAALVGMGSPAFVPLLAAGGLTGGIFAHLLRREYHREVTWLRINVERLLDFLERERVPSSA
jgi:hypothetical protein